MTEPTTVAEALEWTPNYECGMAAAEAVRILQNEVRDLQKLEAVAREIADTDLCDCYDEYGAKRPNAPCHFCRLEALLRTTTTGDTP